MNILGLYLTLQLYMGNGGLPYTSNLFIRFVSQFYEYVWEPIYCAFYTFADTYFLMKVLNSNTPTIYQADYYKAIGNLISLINFIIETTAYVGLMAINAGSASDKLPQKYFITEIHTSTNYVNPHLFRQWVITG